MKAPIKLVYVAGPYRAETAFNVSQHIARARDRAAEVVMSGAYPIVPHACTAFMDGLAPDELFLEGAREAMLRCDEVWLCRGWEYSHGSREEVFEALRWPLPVILPDGEPLTMMAFEDLLAKSAPLHLQALTGLPVESLVGAG